MDAKSVREDLDILMSKCGTEIPSRSANQVRCDQEDLFRVDDKLQKLKHDIVYLTKMAACISTVRHLRSKDCLRDAMDMKSLHNSISKKLAEKGSKLRDVCIKAELQKQMKDMDDSHKETYLRVVK